MQTLEEVEQQAMLLPEVSRRELAERLWNSVTSVEELFTPEQIAEFDRRSKEIRDGEVTGLSHEEVMQGLRDLLRAR